jgi:hypothetical protein
MIDFQSFGMGVRDINKSAAGTCQARTRQGSDRSCLVKLKTLAAMKGPARFLTTRTLNWYSAVEFSTWRSAWRWFLFHAFSAKLLGYKEKSGIQDVMWSMPSPA